MDKEVKILERLKDGCFSEAMINLKDFQMSSDSSPFISRVLHMCLDSLNEVAGHSDVKCLDDLQSVIKCCYDLCKGSAVENGILSAVEKYLYHFIKRLIELGKFFYSKEISTLLCDSLKITTKGIKDVKSLPKEKVTIMKNSYLLFWNTALKITDCYSPNELAITSFHYRLEALKYLSLYSEDVIKFVDQALKAVHTYESYDSAVETSEVLHFHDILFSLLKSNVKMRSKSLNELELVSLFQWFSDYLIFLEKSASNKQIDQVLFSFEKDILKNKLVPDNELKKMSLASLKLVSVCSRLSWKDMQNKLKPMEVADSTAYFSELEKNLLNDISMRNCLLSVTSFALKTCKAFLFGKETNSSTNIKCVEEKVLIIFPVTKLMTTLINLVKDQTCINENYSIDSCHQIVISIWKELLLLLLHSIESCKENEEYIKSLLEQAETIAKESIAILDSLLIESSRIYLNLSTIGTNIWNVGVVCYNKGLFQHAAPFFKMFCDHVAKWCLSDSNEKKIRLKQINLSKKYELLFTSQRKSCQFTEAIYSIVAGIEAYSDFLPSFSEAWVKIKRDAELKGAHDLKNWTIKKAFDDIYPNRDDLNEFIFDLLHKELKSYKSQRFNMKECRYEAIKDMIAIAQTKVQKAISFIELAQLQWIEVIDNSNSAIDCCRKAICLLEDEMAKVKNKSKFPFKDQLATSYFWMYLCKLQIFQEHSQAEANKEEVVPFETQLAAEDDIEEEADIKCDIVPTLYHITINTELKNFQYLEKAIGLWSEITYNEEFSIERETLENLKAIAEIFSVARQIVQEIKVWELIKKATENTVFIEDYILSISRLVRLFCKLHMIEDAEKLLVSCEDLVNREKLGLLEDNVALIKYSLAYAEVCYYNMEVSKGLSKLQELWSSNLFSKKSRTFYILAAELQKISSLYSLISDSSQLNPWGVSTSIELMTEALRYYNSLAKSLSDTSQSSVKVDLPGYSHQVVAGLLDTTLIVGRMYADIGSIREARCYLKEQLKLTQLLGLAYRSAELLLLLAELDTLCSEVDDCQVKLNGITFILESGINFKWEMKDRSSHITVDSKKEIKLTKPNQQTTKPVSSQNSKYIYEDDCIDSVTRCASRNMLNQQVIKKKGFCASDYNIEIPEFITHSVDCDCKKCGDQILLEITVNLLLLHAFCLTLQNKVDDSMKILHSLLNICNTSVNSVSKAPNGMQNMMHLIKSRILINREFLVCKLLFNFSVLLFDLKKFKSSLYKVEKALNIFTKLSLSLQKQHFILHSSLLKQKSICILQLIAIEKNVTPLILLQEKWNLLHCAILSSEEDEINGITQTLRDLNFNSDGEIKTPIKSKNAKSHLSSSSMGDVLEDNIDYVSPTENNSKRMQKISNKSKVCNAPKRKNASSRMPYSVLRKRALDEFDSDSEAGSERITSNSSSDSLPSCIPDTPPKSHKKRIGLKSKEFSSQKSDTNFQKPTRPAVKSKRASELTLKSKETKANESLKRRGRKGSNYSDQDIDEDTVNIKTFSLARTDECKEKIKANETLKRRGRKTNNYSDTDNGEDIENSETFLTTSDGEKERVRQTSSNPVITRSSSKGRNLRGKEKASESVKVLDNNSNSDQKSKKKYLKESSAENVDKPKNGSSNVEMYIETPRCEVEESDLNNSLDNKSTDLDIIFSDDDCSNLSVVEYLDDYPEPEIIRAGRSAKPKTVKESGVLQLKALESEEKSISSLNQELHDILVLSEDVDEDSDAADYKIADWQIEDIDTLLEKAYSLIAHHPPSSLYSEICLLLALLKGCKHKDTAYFLSEAHAITLRYQTLMCLGKKIRKMKETETLSDNKTLPKPLEKPTVDEWRKYREVTEFKKIKSADRSEILNKTLEKLPDEWTICQIACVPSSIDVVSKNYNRSLIISRFKKNKEPIFVLVPNPTEIQTVPKTLLDELQNIKFENKESVKNHDKKLWWETRRDLDNRLKHVATDLENIWLDCWKSFLLGDLPAAEQCEIEEVLGIIQNEFPNNLFDLQILKVLALSLVWLNNEQLYRGIAQATGLSVKSETVKKISRIMRKTINTFNDPQSRNEVILILDKDVQCFPWECMPILRAQPVSRMPSLKLVHGLTEFTLNQSFSVYNQGIDPQKTFFVLNPSSDLQKTQETFEDWFKRQSWTGVTARPPTSDEFTSGLTQHDLFLYVGHGSGTKYLSGDHIQYLDCRAVVLLMGCSSGNLHSYGKDLEACGTVLQYLLGGCPAVVANLWDVTDRDIDRYTKELLESWLPGERQRNLANAVSDSRQICHLPYLIGAAPVLYGLPLHFRFKVR